MEYGKGFQSCVNITIDYKLLYTGYYHNNNNATIARNYIFSQLMHTIYNYNNKCRREQNQIKEYVLMCKIRNDLNMLCLQVNDKEICEILYTFIAQY